MREREPDEDEERTIWLDLYYVRDDGDRDAMMETLTYIAIEEIGFERLRGLIEAQKVAA